jgi:DNA-binding NarL/FixJ family response regulator
MVRHQTELPSSSRPLSPTTGPPDSTSSSARNLSLSPRILTVDDHAVVRRGIQHILASELPGAMLRETATSQEALDAVWEHGWDLVLLDVILPGRGGIELLKEIKRTRPKLPVLMYGMPPEAQFAIRALKAGAAGFLTLDSPAEILLQAVHRLLAGGKYITPTLAEALAVQVGSAADRPSHESLSDREFEVLRLIGSGRTVGEIAEQLHLSVKTISTFRARILTKMEMKNNADLMQYSVRNNLVHCMASSHLFDCRQCKDMADSR